MSLMLTLTLFFVGRTGIREQDPPVRGLFTMLRLARNVAKRCKSWHWNI